jgi:hypothetical protein
MKLLDQVDCRILDLIKAKWFVNLLDQKLMKLLIVEKGLDLNQNLRTREAEQNK